MGVCVCMACAHLSMRGVTGWAGARWPSAPAHTVRSHQPPTSTLLLLGAAIHTHTHTYTALLP